MKNIVGRFKLSVSSWIMLSTIGIIMLVICMIVLCYYKRSFRRYFIQIWRNLTMNKRINTEINSTSTSNLKGSSNTFNGNGSSVILNNIKGQ
jgi:sensor histidine kinase YesM